MCLIGPGPAGFGLSAADFGCVWGCQSLQASGHVRVEGQQLGVSG